MVWQTEISGLTSEQQYSIEIIATNATGDSEPAILNVTTLSYAAPANPRVVGSSVGQASYMVECDPVAGTPTGYRVYLNDMTLIGETSDGLPHVSVTGRTPGASESITVRAYDATGEGSSSASIIVTLVPANPVIVLSEEQDAVTETQIKFVWPLVDGATRYSIYGALFGEEYTLWTTSASTPYTTPELASGSMYKFKITSGNESGDSSYSNELVIQTKYTAPTFSVSGAIEQTAYVLSCNAVSGNPAPQGYRAYLGTTLLGQSENGSLLINITNRVPGSVDLDVRVLAYYGEMEGTRSSAQSIHLLPPTPAISLLSTTPPSVTSTSIEVVWDAVDGADSYFAGINGVFNSTPITSPYSISGLESSTVYTLAIRAANISGYVESSSIVQRTAPAKPGNVVVTGTTPTTFDVAWGSSALAAKWKIYLNDALQVTEYESTEANGVEFPIFDQPCSIKVIAIGFYNEQVLVSDISETVIAVPSVPIDAPASMGPVVPSETAFTVEGWSDVVGAAYYLLNANNTELATQYIAPPAVAVSFTTYSEPTILKIRACNSSGCGPLSSFSVEVSPTAPATPVTSAGDVNDLVPHTLPLTLSWNPRVNAVTYELQIAKGSNFTVLVKTVVGLTTPTFTLENELEEGEIYYWRVRYHNAFGISPWSETHSFILKFSPVYANYPAQGAINISRTPLIDWNPLRFKAQAGDLAIIRVNASSDTFSILALSDIPADQPIKWTDNGWKATGGFRPGETISSIANHGGLVAGQVYEVSGANFTSTGEQIFIYAGSNDAIDTTSAQFIYGIIWGNASGWGITSDSVATSALPVTLETASIQLLGEGNISWYYAGITTGSRQEILAAINDPLNWAVDSTAQKNVWDGASPFTITTKPGIVYDWQLASDPNMQNVIEDGVNQAAYTYQVSENVLGLAANYYIGIRKKSTLNSIFNGDYGITQFTTVAPVSTPSLVAPANQSTEQLRAAELTWNASTGDGEIKYNIQVATDNSFSIESIVHAATNVTETTYQLPSLNYLTTYFWRVQATDVNGVGAWSSAFQYTVADVVTTPILSTPLNASVDLVAPLTFAWESAIGVAPIKYEIEIAEDISFSVSKISNPNVLSTSYQVDVLNRGTGYYWHVRAIDANGVGNWSDALTFTTLIAPPEAPSLDSAIASGAINQPTTIKFVWEAAARAEEYILQVAEDAGFTSLAVNENVGNNLEYSTHLVAFRQYWWKLIAVNAGGSSPVEVRSFTTGLDVPVLDVVENNAEAQIGGSINLSWTIHEISGITNIKVKMGNVSGEYIEERVLQPESRTYTWNDLTNNQLYYFVVTALGNGEQETIASNELFSTPIDVGAPSGVADVVVVNVKTGGGLTITWQNPSTDFSHVVIVRKDSAPAPTTPTDGVVVYSGTGTTYTDLG